jgi:cytochrome c
MALKETTMRGSVFLPTLRLFSTAVGLLSAAGAAHPQDAAALAQSKGCLTCHATDRQKIGPSFKSVAAKYAGNAAAETSILATLQGGRGHPKAAASDAELKSLANYVLSIK